MLLLGRRRRGAVGSAAELVGAALVVSSLAAPLEHWLLRSGSARRRLRIECELRVERSVDDVFEFCRDFENFPRVLHAIERVTDYQDGRSHWAVRTPAGRELEWDAVVTKYVPRSVIAWHSVPGSDVDTGGLIRFAPLDDGATLMRLALTYRPCATDFLEAVHALFDLPPARQMENDLARLPAYLQSRAKLVRNEDELHPDGEAALREARTRVATSPVTPGAPMSRGTGGSEPSSPAA